MSKVSCTHDTNSSMSGSSIDGSSSMLHFFIMDKDYEYFSVRLPKEQQEEALKEVSSTKADIKAVVTGNSEYGRLTEEIRESINDDTISDSQEISYTYISLKGNQ